MNRLIYLGTEGDKKFLEKRRVFLKNTGLLLGLFGVAPSLRFEVTKKLLKAVHLDSLYAQNSLPLFPHHLIEVCFRTGFNFRSVLPPQQGRAPTDAGARKRMAVWSGNSDDSIQGNPSYSYSSYGITQSATTGVWLPSQNNSILYAAQVPMAHFGYSLGGSTHGPNFNLRAANPNNGTMQNQTPVTTNQQPNFSFLHQGLTPHHALFAPVTEIHINQPRFNAAGAEILIPDVRHYSTADFDTSFNPLKFGAQEIGKIRKSINGQSVSGQGKDASALMTLLQQQVLQLRNSVASLTSEQLSPVMSEVTRLAQSRLTQLQAQNAATIVRNPQALKSILATQVSQLLSLSTAEQELFGAQDGNQGHDIFCPTTDYNVDSQRYAKYNLGFWLGTVAKAFEYGLLQRVILNVEVTDHHADANNAEGGSFLNNGGWQRDQMRTGLGVLKALEAWHQYTKSKVSLSSEQSLFDDSAILLTSDLGRRPETRVSAQDEETTSLNNAMGGNGAHTDTGDGTAILVASDRLIHSGTFYDHTATHLQMEYPMDKTNGAVARDFNNHSSNEPAMPPAEAWKMTARALVGDQNLGQFTQANSAYSYILKR